MKQGGPSDDNLVSSSPAHDRDAAIEGAAKSGDMFDLQVKDPDQNRPERGATWGPDRAVSAEVVAKLLIEKPAQGAASLRGLRIKGARIVGELNLEAATLGCPLSLEQCFFDKAVVLNEASAPSIRLSGSHLPGVRARQLVTRGDLDLSNGFTALEGVDVRGSHIGGRLSCRGGHFANATGRALNATGITVDQELLCSDGFIAEGEVAVIGAHVGYLDCSKGEFHNPSGQALAADGLMVDRDMLCNEKFKAEGEVSLIGAHIGGNFHCGSGHFHNPGGSALVADNLIVDQDMFCHEGFRADGEVSFQGMRVKGELNCSDGHFNNPDGFAMIADGLAVDQDLLCSGEFTAAGDVSFEGARVTGAYRDEPASWPKQIELGHFTYGSLDPATTPVSDRWNVDGWNWGWAAKLNWWVHGGSVADRLKWLKRNASGYSPEIYEQLIEVYSSMGSDEEARKVAIAKQRERRGQLGLVGKLWNGLLHLTVGYGYRTWQAALWIVGLLAIGSLVFGWLHDGKLLTPAHATVEQPPWQPAIFTLDLLLPVVNLHQRDAWIAHDPAEWWVLGFTIAGWILATAVVLSLSGILRKN